MRRLSEFTPDCSASTRVASWSDDISRLKNATGAPLDFSGSLLMARSWTKRSAQAKAILVASAVLPMAGRPARMTRSDVCSPPIFSFSALSPVV